MSRLQHVPGRRYGHWTLVSRDGYRLPRGAGGAIVTVRCDCGHVAANMGLGNLTSGRSTQCKQCGYASMKITLAHGGETLTLDEWAARTGVTHAALRSRLKKGIPAARSLDPRTMHTGPLAGQIQIGGISHTAAEWLAYTGITRQAYSVRVKSGWARLDALLTPRGRGPR